MMGHTIAPYGQQHERHATIMMDVLLILGLLIGIVGACTVFTNAIEWIGEKLNLSAGAVGSVLAAVGTALPETIVPIVAIISGVLATGGAGGGISAEAGSEIGIGAILGAPFMLGTLAMFISGLAIIIYKLMGKRELALNIDKGQFNRDMTYFFIAYGLAVASSFLPASIHHFRYIVPFILLALYGLYLKQTLSAPEVDIPENDTHQLDALFFAPKSINPGLNIVVFQTVVGLVLIVVLAHLFVNEIHTLAERFHLNAMILSLIIIPIATELPEKFNSVVWLGKHKDTLAIGNLTGAMVFQSCIPVAVGVAFTPWVLNHQALTSVMLCLATSILITVCLFRFGAKGAPFVLLTGGLAYAYFVYDVVKPLLASAS
jgi:cation:H+ antiporter